VGVSSLELGAGADQQVLVETLASFSRDPYAFVLLGVSVGREGHDP
jgi:hypothetical protein